MKYILKKEYPGSPKLGYIDDLNKSGHNNQGEYVQSMYDKNPEFWEKVVEKNYKVLSFELNKKIFKLDENKNKYFAEDGNYANYVEMLNDNRIISICRLSDGEIFTIDDSVNMFKEISTIKSFRILPNGEFVIDFDNKCSVIGIKNITKAKPVLFVTEDGVDKYKGDKLYSHSNWELWEYTITDGDISPLSWFSSKEKAQEYILMNKPVLSINDLKDKFDYFGDRGNNEIKLKELVKSKL